jgi:hypothetical protein
MEIKLTTEESENYFHNSLCNGLSYIGDYGLELWYDEDENDKAKQNLTSPCYEDVLMEILKQGNKLHLVDNENEGDYTRTITLEEVHERVQLTPIRHLIDAVNERDDATTADVLIQTVFYNEVIFG